MAKVFQFPVKIPSILTDIVARAYNIDTTQKVISELRHLIVELKANIRLQTTTTTINRAETPSRKRNSEDEDLPNGHVGKKPRVAVSKSSIGSSWKGTRFEGVSFTVPQRKKLSLTISSSKNEGLIASGSGVDTPEFGVPWSQVEHVMCLPVPEKTQAQRSFIVFPRGVDGLGETTSDHEMMVWTVPDTKTKGAADDEPTQAQAIKSALSQRSKLLEPDPTDFTSEIPPAGSKKGEKAYHIKAFKGSKDGKLSAPLC